MGMDVIGKAPRSDAGRHFRNSAWFWRPLADYACATAPDITSRCADWHDNTGDGLDADDAASLADALQAEIVSGACQTYADRYQAAVDAMPDEDCNLCNGTGVRADDIGVEAGWTERRIDDATHPRFGETGWCNKCDGRGFVRPYATQYPFEVGNVQAFVTFLRASGGFEIH